MSLSGFPSIDRSIIQPAMSAATKFVTYQSKESSKKSKAKAKANESKGNKTKGGETGEEACEEIREVHEHMASALTRLARKLTTEDLQKMTEERCFVAEQVKRARELAEEIKVVAVPELVGELKEVLDGLKGKLGKVGSDGGMHEAAVGRVVYLRPGPLDALVAEGKCTKFVGADGTYVEHLTIPRSLILGAFGGNGQPDVAMEDDLEAIVGCDAQKTIENYALASEVHGTPVFVHTTMTELCKAAEAAHEKEEEPAAKEHMLSVLNALTSIREAYQGMVAEGVADADETRVATLMHLPELRTQQTPVWQTFLDFSAGLLQAAYEKASVSMGAERALEAMRALGTQMHAIVNKMREGVRDAGVFEYFVMEAEEESTDDGHGHEQEQEQEQERESTDDAHEQEEEQASKQRGLVIKKAVEVGMASGSARGLWDYSEEGLEGGSASEDTCVAFFLEGDEAIYGTGGLEEQIKAKRRQHAEAYAAAARGESGPHDREAREAREALVSAGDILHELAELEEKKGNLRTAMQEATRSVPAARVARALEMAMKRKSSESSEAMDSEASVEPARKRSRCGSGREATAAEEDMDA